MSDLEQDYSMKEVALAIGMSERWVRQKVKDGAEHTRYGHKIRFSATQVQKLRESHVVNPVPRSITTGRKRGA